MYLFSYLLQLNSNQCSNQQYRTTGVLDKGILLKYFKYGLKYNLPNRYWWGQPD